MKHKMKIMVVFLAAVLISITTVYAATIIKSSDVFYDNSKSKGESSNVQGAIDDLYKKASDIPNTSAYLPQNSLLKYV